MPLGRRGVLLCIATAALAGLAYFNALHNPFVYDDHRTILENGSIVRVGDLRAIAGHDATRPLVNLSYAVDRAIFGPEPFGFHLTSVALHVLNVALLFMLAWRLAADWQARGGRESTFVAPATASLAAALFAVHPMMSEAVGYVSGRSDVLSATWILLAFLAARSGLMRSSVKSWLAAIACWLLALATKETAAMLPLLVLAADRLVLPGDPEARRRRLVSRHLPWIAVAAIAALVRIVVFVWIEHPGEAAVDWLSFFDELNVTRRYLGLLLLPRGQTIFHEVVPVASAFDGAALLGIVTLALLLVWSWRLRLRNGFVAFGIVWFLLMLVPAVALVMMGQGEGMAEHRVYLASAGLFLAAGSVTAGLGDRLGRPNRVWRWLTVAACTALVLSLTGRTLYRNAVWRSPVTLWQEAANLSPGAWAPRAALGESLHDTGRHAEAVNAYQAAIVLEPREPLGYFKLSLCLAEQRRFAEAVSTLEQLRQIDPQSTVVSTGRGVVAFLGGDVDRARRELQAAVAADPRDVLSREWLAALEGHAGNPAEALRLCEEIQRITPGRLSNDECLRKNRSRVAAGGSR